MRLIVVIIALLTLTGCGRKFPDSGNNTYSDGIFRTSDPFEAVMANAEVRQIIMRLHDSGSPGYSFLILTKDGQIKVAVTVSTTSARYGDFWEVYVSQENIPARILLREQE